LSIHLNLPSISGSWELEKLRLFLFLPKAIQLKAIVAIAQKLDFITIAARIIVDSQKLTNKDYAKAAGKKPELINFFDLTDSQKQELISEKRENICLPIPALSNNMLRHCLLRESGANHLFEYLELEPSKIPVGITRLFYSGGQLAAKSKTPNNWTLLEAEIRKNYPLLDALGGSVDSFLFRESQTKVSSWIICSENNQATKAIAGITSSSSVFDFLEENTNTRQGINGNDKESGQMLINFETLAPGLEVLVEIAFNPFTNPIAIACIENAILSWDKILGGKSQIGHGKFEISELQSLVNKELYLEHLNAHKTLLKTGILDRTLGTGKELCAA
jgi:hypothetical protein